MRNLFSNGKSVLSSLVPMLRVILHLKAHIPHGCFCWLMGIFLRRAGTLFFECQNIIVKDNYVGGLRVMKLKPLNDRVLVKRLESEEKTAGGLYIPDTAKEKPSKGEVVAAGPGKVADDGKRVAMAVKAGDTVLFNKYAGTEVKLDGVEHLVMREDDILAVIE